MATVEVAADLAEEVSEVEALEAEEPEAVFKNKNIHNFNSCRTSSIGVWK